MYPSLYPINILWTYRIRGTINSSTPRYIQRGFDVNLSTLSVNPMPRFQLIFCWIFYSQVCAWARGHSRKIPFPIPPLPMPNYVGWSGMDINSSIRALYHLATLFCSSFRYVKVKYHDTYESHSVNIDTMNIK